AARPFAEMVLGVGKPEALGLRQLPGEQVDQVADELAVRHRGAEHPFVALVVMRWAVPLTTICGTSSSRKICAAARLAGLLTLPMASDTSSRVAKRRAITAASSGLPAPSPTPRSILAPAPPPARVLRPTTHPNPSRTALPR